MPRPYVVLALLLAAAGCGPPAELIGVYEEAAPLELGRTRAIRLTLFAYSGEAGGKMETFLLGDQNTTEDPYLVPEACAYFGPRDISNSAFALDVRFGEQQVAGRVFDVSSGDRAELELTDGEALLRSPVIPGRRFVLVRNEDKSATDSCGETGDLLTPEGSQ